MAARKTRMAISPRLATRSFCWIAMLSCVEELRSLEAGEPTTEFANIDFLRIWPVC